MGVTPTIQTVKNLEVEVRKNDGEKLYDETTSWANTTVFPETEEPKKDTLQREEYDSDDEEPILSMAPASRAPTPEPAPASPSNDEMDTNNDEPSLTPVQKETARVQEIRDIYYGPCPPSPIAPVIQPWTRQDEVDHWAWEQRQIYDEQKLFDNNTDWLYVPSFPLRANITLIDPSSVDLTEDPVDSGIIN